MYTAALVSDLEKQNMFQKAIFALIAGTTAARLFDGSSDQIKGLAFGSGAVYAFGEVNMISDHRKTLKSAADQSRHNHRYIGAWLYATAPFL